LQLKHCGKSIRPLLDTGSSVSLIRSTLAHKLNIPIWDIQPGDMSCLFTAEGSKLNTDGLAAITFNVSGLFFIHSVYYVSNMNSESLIFGCNFMSQNQVIIDYFNKIVSLQWRIQGAETYTFRARRAETYEKRTSWILMPRLGSRENTILDQRVTIPSTIFALLLV
jgi:hypothetical protein